MSDAVQNVKWLLEPEVFNDEEAPIVEALDRLGYEHVEIKFGKSYEDYLRSFKNDDCVVFHGSFQAGFFFWGNTQWIPGVYCNDAEFECVSYYPKLGQYLLNSQYIMLPFGELDRFKNWLFAKFLTDNKLFVRPASGRKSFTGNVFSAATWEKDIKLAAFYSTPPEAIVIVAPEIEIDKEWRLLVVDGKVVTASQYKSIERPKPPAEVLAYGQMVIDESGFDPQPVWVLDICLAEEEYHVVEAGPFSCCALYNCDPEIVVREVSKVALRDWENVAEAKRKKS